jgi:mRNA interferase MazF
MTVSRGDVVLVDVPFITRAGSKIRPMLVVQNDQNNQRMTNTILATITSNTSRSDEATQLLIDISTPDGQQSGLLQNSVVSTENLLTVRQSHIRRVIGRLPDSLLSGVNAALKVSLDLA